MPYKKCPVPDSQQPRNEYEVLKQSYLFALTILPIRKYFVQLLKIILVSVIVASPFIASMINFLKEPLHFILINSIVATIVLVLILLRTYLGWSYISKRLLSATIVYEESGWYDIQIWIKSPIELAQDRLIAEYTIKPTLQRIQYTSQYLIAYLLFLQLKNVML